MGFRTVDQSSFTFQTDLPPSSRNIHPSGVLHAFRTSSSGTNSTAREEHTFAWITNSLYIESALDQLEKHGFNRSHGIVFIPYSTKRNWLDRYPHAAPALDCTEGGKVVVYLNWRPYPNGLGELGENDVSGAAVAKKAAVRGGVGGAGAKTCTVFDNNDDEDNNSSSNTPIKPSSSSGPKKRKYKSRTINMVQDNSFLPDAQRDELHVEIYNYFTWLHSKLAELEKKAVAAEALTTVADMNDDEIDPEIVDEKKIEAAKKLKDSKGVDVIELQRVLDKLESTFLIIPNIKLEEIDDGGVAAQKGAPFLEEALSEALGQLVTARELAGKPKRRSRKRQRKRINNPRRSHDRNGLDFDLMYQRLVQYYEEHGNASVPKNYKEDAQLGGWVQRIREKKANLVRKGIEVEEIPPGKPILAKTLTAERLEKLNSIGFVWSMMGPKVAWEDRFQDLMDYYELNGKWPSQSMGSLGEWVHKQRGMYSRNDSNYMKTKAPKLDEVGFEWTPRGNTRMSWDEGFEMLIEFGRINGHFDVPCPSAASEETDDGKLVDKKSDAHRLYKWVESLHGMYRSYKLGRRSGSLTDDRVVLLIKHGFVFRND